MTFTQIIKSITRKEWRFVVFMVLLMLILTSAPYLYGYFTTPGDQYFLGIHTFAAGDIPVYYSYIEQVKEGHFLFNDLFTSEPHLKTLNIFWLSAGLFAKLFNLSPRLSFQLYRLLLIPLFLFFLYLFISYFFREIKKRKICFILMLFASGLGGLSSPFLEKILPASLNQPGRYEWPMDLWVTESNIFLTLLQTPHFIASLLLIILIFLFAVLAFNGNKIKYSITAGLLNLILFQFHPFHVPTIFIVITIYLITISLKYKKIKWDYLKHAVIIFSLSLPPIIYYFYLTHADLVMGQKAIQNINLTPAWWLTLISYGFLLILAIMGIIKIIKTSFYSTPADKKQSLLFTLKNIDNKWLFIIVWLVSQSFLIYSPFNWQRRMTEGLEIPMVILTTVGLYFVYNFSKKILSSKKLAIIINNKIFLAYLFIFFLFFSNIFNLSRDFFYYYKNYSLFYIPQQRAEAMFWLKNIPPDQIILSENTNGNIIPGLAARKIYVGHWAETIFPDKKKKEMLQFFRDNKNDEQKLAWLKEKNIGYIFFGKREKALGKFNPEEKKYLKKVYKNKMVSIYKVDHRAKSAASQRL